MMNPYKHIHENALYLAGYLLQAVSPCEGQVTFRVTRGPAEAVRLIGVYARGDRERFLADLLRDVEQHGFEDEVHIEGQYSPAHAMPRVDLSARINREGVSFAALAQFSETTDAVN